MPHNSARNFENVTTGTVLVRNRRSRIGAALGHIGTALEKPARAFTIPSVVTVCGHPNPFFRAARSSPYYWKIIMSIEYKVNQPITVDQFIELLNASTLGERRPVDNLECMRGMIDNANLTVTAWEGEQLVGVARSVTDFHYACYLSDLAVHRDYQRRGIGKALQDVTQRQLGPECRLILIAAPAASDYYGPLGYTHNPRCWVLERDCSIRA